VVRNLYPIFADILEHQRFSHSKKADDTLHDFLFPHNFSLRIFFSYRKLTTSQHQSFLSRHIFSYWRCFNRRCSTCIQWHNTHIWQNFGFFLERIFKYYCWRTILQILEWRRVLKRLFGLDFLVLGTMGLRK